MTNARIYVNGKLDPIASKEFRKRPVPTEKEIQAMLDKADLIENTYFKLRAKAIIALIKVFGKRRVELTMLEMSDISENNGLLYITFNIAKKSKRGFRQYIDYLKDQISKGKIQQSELNDKTYLELTLSLKEWNKTKEGTNISQTRKPKATPLTDKYAKLIHEYYFYLKNNYPNSRYLFPSGKTIFGNYYLINNNSAISGRQLLRIIKPLDSRVWLHLLRKEKGQAVALKYGRTLESVFNVKDCLDLSRIETAMHYVDAVVPKIETGETQVTIQD